MISHLIIINLLRVYLSYLQAMGVRLTIEQLFRPTSVFTSFNNMLELLDLTFSEFTTFTIR